MQRMRRPAALLVALTLFLAPLAPARQRPRWSDTYVSRVELLALIETLNAEILASTSATKTLESWCADHQMAAEPKIVAVRIAGAAKEPSREQLDRLAVHDATEVKYRRVELRCGAHLFSVADNWYVPARLTPEMNALLETTEMPFGKAVAPLKPYRRTLSATMLWSPLPHGWEQQPRVPSHPRRALAVPRELFEHRAVLYTAEHVAFSEVVETYQGELMGFGSSPDRRTLPPR